MRTLGRMEANKKNVQITDKFSDGIFLGIKEGPESSWSEYRLVVWCAELSKDALVKTQQTRFFQQHPWNT